MTDTGSLAYDRAGSGPPLVLIHGLGGTRGIWRPQFEALAAHRDVIAVDMPGFGESPPLPDDVPATAAALGEAISDFCLTLGVERPHLAGNSLGAWVALEMARAGNATSLCLISPAGLWRRPLGERAVNTRATAQRLRPLLFALARSRGTLNRVLRTTVGHPERIPAPEALALIRGWIDAPGYEAANEQMRAGIFERPDLIDVPTTIAWGEMDGLVAPPRPERRPPGTRFLVLEDCGHTPNWDDPELITRVLLEASNLDDAADPSSEEAAA